MISPLSFSSSSLLTTALSVSPPPGHQACPVTSSLQQVQPSYRESLSLASSFLPFTPTHCGSHHLSSCPCPCQPLASLTLFSLSSSGKPQPRTVLHHPIVQSGHDDTMAIPPTSQPADVRGVSDPTCYVSEMTPLPLLYRENKAIRGKALCCISKPQVCPLTPQLLLPQLPLRLCPSHPPPPHLLFPISGPHPHSCPLYRSWP